MNGFHCNGLLRNFVCRIDVSGIERHAEPDEFGAWMSDERQRSTDVSFHESAAARPAGLAGVWSMNLTGQTGRLTAPGKRNGEPAGNPSLTYSIQFGIQVFSWARTWRFDCHIGKSQATPFARHAHQLKRSPSTTV
jgi:hypothetical protein